MLPPIYGGNPAALAASGWSPSHSHSLGYGEPCWSRALVVRPGAPEVRP